MKIKKVKPLDNTKENRCVYITVIITLIISLSLIFLTNNSKFERVLSNNEISSFDNFNSEENGIYSDLYNYSSELELNTQISDFKSVVELENENVYPFVKDDLWIKRGSIDWVKLERENIVYYIGKSNNKDIGNFILSSKIREDGVENTILYYKGKIENPKDAIKNIEKFKKIIPLKGEDLMNQANGE